MAGSISRRASNSSAMDSRCDSMTKASGSMRRSTDISRMNVPSPGRISTRLRLSSARSASRTEVRHQNFSATRARRRRLRSPAPLGILSDLPADRLVDAGGLDGRQMHPSSTSVGRAPFGMERRRSGQRIQLSRRRTRRTREPPRSRDDGARLRELGIAADDRPTERPASDLLQSSRPPRTRMPPPARRSRIRFLTGQEAPPPPPWHESAIPNTTSGDCRAAPATAARCPVITRGDTMTIPPPSGGPAHVPLAAPSTLAHQLGRSRSTTGPATWFRGIYKYVMMGNHISGSPTAPSTPDRPRLHLLGSERTSNARSSSALSPAR